LNPAVVFGIQLEAMIEGGVGSDGLPACLFIIVSEFVGAGLADLVFRKIYVKTYAKWKNNLS
jgi:glycerol uptake facilitator-like aquaporin